MIMIMIWPRGFNITGQMPMKYRALFTQWVWIDSTDSCWRRITKVRSHWSITHAYAIDMLVVRYYLTASEAW